MRYLPFLLAALLLTQASCQKEPTPAEPPKVALQTDYRLMEVKTDTGTAISYTYNVQDLVSRVLSYYNVYHFHYTVPGTNTASTYYTYDDQYRVVKSANKPVDETDDYNTYSYNTGLLPIARLKEKYDHPLYEYEYDGKRLTELRTYDINGKLVSTETWAYNGSDNAVSYTKTNNSPTALGLTIKYLEYDNAHALRLAMPGIQDLELAVSVNNVLKMERITSDVNGDPVSTIITYQYEYNEGNFPVKSTSTLSSKGTTTAYGPLYYIYNK